MFVCFFTPILFLGIQGDFNLTAILIQFLSTTNSGQPTEGITEVKAILRYFLSFTAFF